jgi:hypothetical protein
MRITLVFFLVLFFLPACKKDGATTYKNLKGTLAGAPGCSEWIIRQDNGTPWQPMNIDSFQVTLKGGQPVIFSFNITDYGSVCQDGEIIELTSIHDR